MAERLIQIQVPAEKAEWLREFLTRTDGVTSWHDSTDDVRVITVQVPAERVEAVLDPVQSALGTVEGFRAFVLSVEASLPRREEEPPKTADVPAAAEPPSRGLSRISREELYADLSELAKTNRGFLAMVFLSTIVAAVGLARDNTAAIIGAMVIAPLLGPNMGLSLAVTLGDPTLAARALRTNAIGIVLATIVAFACGFILDVNPSAPEIASRTFVGPSDLIVALAAGIAGALAFTTGIPASVVGVMVAVALLPPLVVGAMLLANGHVRDALEALLLLLTNVIAVNLAGVGTFLLQGVSPRSWWDAERSKRMTRRALAVWVSLLVLVIVLITLSNLTRPS
jgi:uncharacterized hydrophobic protein (TIGR00341 family)